MTIYAFTVIMLFVFASIAEAVNHRWALSGFYILSALINLVVPLVGK